MIYDVINGDTDCGHQPGDVFTLGDLIDVLYGAGDIPVRFIDTDYTIGELRSWRGSYDIPSITYVNAKYDRDPPANVLAMELEQALKEKHYGYKGGEFRYSKDDEFYVSEYSRWQEYKIIDANVVDGILILTTKLVPY